MRTPSAGRPPSLFPGRPFLAPVGDVLPGGALPEVRPSPRIWSRAALTAEAPAAKLVITDLSGRPYHEFQNFNATARELVVVVGQPVRLAVRSKPDHPVSDVTWAVEGDAVHISTRQTPAMGTAVPLADHLGDASIEFHWISGGTRRVTVSASVGGEWRTTSLTCRVLAPIVILFTVTTSGFTLFSDYREEDDQWLVLGRTDTDRGCKRDAILLPPELPAGAPSARGSFGFIQLFRAVAGTRNPSTGRFTVTTSVGRDDAFVLDMGTDPASVLVGDGRGVDAGAADQVFVGGRRVDSDSPGLRLDGSDYGALWDHFKLYLVYRPPTPGGIWVTLQTLEWGCTAAAALDGSGVWQGPTDVHVAPPPGTPLRGVASSELPTWNRSSAMLQQMSCDEAEFSALWDRMGR